MKTVRTQDAVGTILCHDLTRIVIGEGKETIFRKGHVVQPQDVDILLSMGKLNLFVLELGQNMVHENDAAKALKDIAVTEGFVATEAKEGKVSLSAGADGLFLADLARLEAVNDFDEISIATRVSGTQVKSGDEVAAFKIIPLLIHQGIIDQFKLRLSGRPLMAIKPFLRLKAGIIATGSEIYHGRIKDEFTGVVEKKLLEVGIKTVVTTICDDKIDMISEAIRSFLEKGVEFIVCTGGMSVDPDDLTPGAIKASGAEVITYGAPALPGAMFLMAYHGHVPVVGLPGCVMFGKRTIFDIILPRVAVGLRVTRQEIRHLGHGGLCLCCRHCIFPACSFGRGWPYSL
ncbi:MAG: molybdopterin-binding protein [Deltaproteobacteria bacterium]|jgi:molybdenum cofactor synthesis domain-containing protein|nr:molybdopterin-binding protein [Deltaproteobacteria bacterium]